jgi:hypothetical protein
MQSQATGYLGSLSKEQSVALAVFKNDAKIENGKIWHYDLSQFDDYDYLRFLRARKFDRVKTFKMFDKYIKWRIESKVDDLLVLSSTNT